jgi:hypothetical protein
MIKKIMFVFLAAMLMFMIGCSSSPDSNGDSQQASIDAPQFFLAPPSSDDAIYGVGVAKVGDIDKSRTMALSRARDDVARQIDILIKNAITDYSQDAGHDSTQTIKFIEIVSRQIVNTKLSGVKPKEMYPAKDGTIYALVEYKVNNFTADAAETFKRNEEAAFSEFKASQALEKLNYEIKNNPTKSEPNLE